MYEGAIVIRAIILDCFGVLYIPKSNYMYQLLLANPHRHQDEIRDLVAQNEYGLIDDETLFAEIAQLTGLSLDTVQQSLVNDFVRNDQLIDYVQKLRPRLLVGMLSNLGHDSAVRYFSAKERAELFDAVVISGDIGMIKPHSEIYEYTCGQLGVDTSEAIMIDNAEQNCTGAQAAGLQAILFRNTAQIIHELDQLLVQ